MTEVHGETIVLDYQTFQDVTFLKCNLIYRGGRPPVLQNVRIVGCHFFFEGPADQTVGMLQMLAHMGDAELVVNNVLGLKDWAKVDGQPE